MDISFIKKMIKIVENSNVEEIELEEEGKRIRISRGKNTASMQPYPMQIPGMPPGYPPMQIFQQPSPAAPAAGAAPGPAAPEPELPTKVDPKYHEIRSPIVGTFYRAPSPDADPYVEVGQAIKQGDVLCIVEAMKLMNEIESDISGEIVKILVDNARPVEYNQVLFLIKPD
jgi:acetyl-CoA carboxylase biotin carboxyl carrier protein